jgi:hypothetical protein
VRPTRVLLGLEHDQCLSLKHSAYRYRTSARHNGWDDRQDRRSHFTSEPGNGMKQERLNIIHWGKHLLRLDSSFFCSADSVFQPNRHAKHVQKRLGTCKPRRAEPHCRLFRSSSGARPFSQMRRPRSPSFVDVPLYIAVRGSAARPQGRHVSTSALKSPTGLRTRKLPPGIRRPPHFSVSIGRLPLRSVDSSRFHTRTRCRKTAWLACGYLNPRSCISSPSVYM